MRALLVIVPLCAIACARTKPSPAPVASPPAPPPREPVTAPPATPPPATSPPATHYSHDEHYPPDRVVVVADWLREHGVSMVFRERECWDAGDRVGVPPRAGLLCESYHPDPPRRSARLFRLEGARLRNVWTATVGTWANWLELTPVIDREGARVVLHDERPGQCQSAQCSHRQKQAHGIESTFGDVLDEGCAGIGTYRWERDRYVRDPTEPGPKVVSDCDPFEL